MVGRERLRPVEIVPSIYAADFARLGVQLAALLDAGARLFHFDVGDGRFIPEITMGPVVLRAIAPAIHERGASIRCHLMIEEPERQFEHLQRAGADGVSFHIEAHADLEGAISHARALGLVSGVAFNPETPVEEAAAAARVADYALCMSIHPGLSGQSFLPEAYERIRRLRALLPDHPIAVDGGVHESNIAAVARAGADLLVAGSAIFWGGDPATAYWRLRARLQESPEARS